MDSEVCELSEYEQYVYNLTLTGDENVIGIIKIEAKDYASRVILTENVIKKALFYMYKRHPLFRASIKQNNVCNGDKLKIWFQINNQIPSNEQFLDYEYCECNNYSEAINELEIFNSKKFNYSDQTSLLWRFKVILLNETSKNISYFLALTLPLYTTDGINMSTICVEIFNIINSILNQSECNEMHEKLELVENMHQLLEKHLLFNGEIQSNLKELIKNDKYVNFNIPYIFRPAYDCKSSTLLAKINLLRVNETQTRKIINYSKLNRIRLTGYFISAALYTFKILYKEMNFIIQRDFSCFVPANLRIRLKPEIDFSHVRFLVVLVSINMFYPEFNFDGLNDECIMNETEENYSHIRDRIWSNAKYVNSCLAEKTQFQNGGLLQYTHNFEAMSEANKMFSNRVNDDDISKLSSELNRFSFSDFVLSNIGTYVNDRKQAVKEGPFNLIELYHGDLLVSNPSNFAPIMLHVCTWQDQFMFQLSSNRNTFDGKHADRFMQIFEKVLEKTI